MGIVSAAQMWERMDTLKCGELQSGLLSRIRYWSAVDGKIELPPVGESQFLGH